MAMRRGSRRWSNGINNKQGSYNRDTSSSRSKCVSGRHQHPSRRANLTSLKSYLDKRQQASQQSDACIRKCGFGKTQLPVALGRFQPLRERECREGDNEIWARQAALRKDQV